jgi:hypothetical protein
MLPMNTYYIFRSQTQGPSHGASNILKSAVLKLVKKVRMLLLLLLGSCSSSQVFHYICQTEISL